MLDKREKFREPGFGTMSLDRRNPLSPQKKKLDVVDSGVSLVEDGERETHIGGDHTPNTDPAHRRMRGVVRSEETDGPLTSTESGGGGGLAGGGREERNVVSSKKPPLPPGVRESRREHDKQQQQQTLLLQQQQQQQQQQKDMQQTKSMENVLAVGVKEAGREEGGRSHQFNENLAQMRARGHKRASSAPVPYQPPPPPSSHLPLPPHIETREAKEDTGTTHVQVHVFEK